ncbi:hypothetical protein CSKR_200640 [Clonorchis sinensis]|uniref:Uncharacterized protein n=1 Tax=Clonorchis sinensis TaxID=79923 RepID=A0A8T1MF18_CLOSI|nr:hypothetical protein CSKR_200640 [Clonorchis sinensis]
MLQCGDDIESSRTLYAESFDNEGRGKHKFTNDNDDQSDKDDDDDDVDEEGDEDDGDEDGDDDDEGSPHHQFPQQSTVSTPFTDKSSGKTTPKLRPEDIVSSIELRKLVVSFILMTTSIMTKVGTKMVHLSKAITDNEEGFTHR